ncbi:hypothetical protein R50073_06850 [Maricurvus nonylphenolicus]|uniref:TetR/AcrR family transcriptional regulator n=1 Tax=Maricurvus nonylphenolicus TaxID=1008307 RepID=UPI0036F218CF
MPETGSINKRLPKVPTQQRSRERFEHILDCAEAILEEGEVEELSIYDVAEKAELQAQSVYRLFPSAVAINYALAQRYLDKMADDITATKSNQTFTAWQDNFERDLQLTREFYHAHPLALELILGSSVSKDVRAADRANIARLANSAMESLRGKDNLPNLPIQKLEIAIDIVDAIWSQSYYSHGEITDFYFKESFRAATSYLELYLPRYNADE